MAIDEIGTTVDIVGFWKFNDRLRDCSGNQNDPTVGGSPTYVDGFFNSALDFNGSTDYLLFDTNIADGFTEATFMAMINTDDPTLAQQGIVGEYSPGMIFSILNPGQIKLYDGTTNHVSTASIVTQDTWHHVVVTYEASGDVKFYIDGELDSTSGTAGSTSLPTGQSTRIGMYGSGGGYFDGTLNDVRIYNRALTATEIKTIYNITGIPSITASVDVNNIWRTSVLSEVSITDGLIGYFKLNGEVESWAGNLTGSITGSPTYTSGIDGQAMVFDNTNPDWVSWNLNMAGLNTFTVMGLWYPTKDFNDGSFSGSMIKSNSPETYEFHLGQEWGNIVFYVRGSDDILNGVAGSTFTGAQNKWMHLTGVFNVDTIELYEDAVSQGTFSDGTSDRTLLCTQVTIAKGNSANYFDGYLDEIRVYNRALTAEEIKIAYNLTIGNGRMVLTSGGQTYIKGELRET